MSPLPGIRPHRGDQGAQGMTETKHLPTLLTIHSVSMHQKAERNEGLKRP